MTVELSFKKPVMISLLIVLIGCKSQFPTGEVSKLANNYTESYQISPIEDLAKAYGFITFREYVADCQDDVSVRIPALSCEDMPEIPPVEVYTGFPEPKANQISTNEYEYRGFRTRNHSWVNGKGESVYWVQNCIDHRRKEYTLSMLGVNLASGKTCFFHSHFNQQGSSLPSPVQKLLKRDEKEPSGWMTPMELAIHHQPNQICTTCHKSRPVIRTIAQQPNRLFAALARTGELDKDLGADAPLLALDGPYEAVAKDRLNELYWGNDWSTTQLEGDKIDKTCQSCHLKNMGNKVPISYMDIFQMKKLGLKFEEYSQKEGKHFNQSIEGMDIYHFDQKNFRKSVTIDNLHELINDCAFQQKDCISTPLRLEDGVSKIGRGDFEIRGPTYIDLHLQSISYSVKYAKSKEKKEALIEAGSKEHELSFKCSKVIWDRNRQRVEKCLSAGVSLFLNTADNHQNVFLANLHRKDLIRRSERSDLDTNGAFWLPEPLRYFESKIDNEIVYLRFCHMDEGGCSADNDAAISFSFSLSDGIGNSLIW